MCNHILNNFFICITKKPNRDAAQEAIEQAQAKLPEEMSDAEYSQHAKVLHGLVGKYLEVGEKTVVSNPSKFKP